MVDSCGECDHCRNGEEYCLKANVPTYAGVDKYGEPAQGGYSTHIVVTENFVVRIPDTIGLDAAAPLLCAGITTYSPLNHWGVGPGSKVAVVGMGGLGHMAVQIAHAMGAEVTVLSHTLKKKADGLQLGADHYYATSDPETYGKLAGSMIGGIRETQEMLDFCAKHHIAPMIEVISADQIDEAYERVLASDVKYRFVIDVSTM
jgi:Zn-dependent alcohol dehydrogenases